MKKYSSGFSLIELLIASSILMMVMFIASYAYSLYASFWSKELGSFHRNVSQTRGLSQLHHILSNVNPHMVKSNEGNWYHYFDGASQYIKSFTFESIEEPNVPAIFELNVVQDNGQYSLVYKETAINSFPVIIESQVNAAGEDQRLLSGLEAIQFEYWGWSHVDDYFMAIETPNIIAPAWFGFYSGKDTMIPPLIIKVTFTKDGVQSSFKIPLKHFNPDYISAYMNSEDA